MLYEELASFKTIVRHIAKHEVSEEDGRTFTTERRQQLRRLVDLGVIGKQPAIAAYCQTAVKEDDAIIESILIQNAGSITNTVKLIAAGCLKTKGGLV